jgi:hypothetical protein
MEQPPKKTTGADAQIVRTFDQYLRVVPDD